MPDLYLTYLSGPDVAAAALADTEILAAIEAALAMQGRGETVIEPRVHLEPNAAEGHFNVLRGFVEGPIGVAGVKVVGDFVGNYIRGLPSKLGLLCLFDPETGARARTSWSRRPGSARRSRCCPVPVGHRARPCAARQGRRRAGQRLRYA